MDASEECLPEWWRKNSKLRREMELPAYEPPKFNDGVYTHKAVSKLESKYDVIIRFGSIKPKYPDDWTVWVDGEPVMKIGRHRKKDANTVYEMSSTEFYTEMANRLSE